MGQSFLFISFSCFRHKWNLNKLPNTIVYVLLEFSKIAKHHNFIFTSLCEDEIWGYSNMIILSSPSITNCPPHPTPPTHNLTLLPSGSSESDWVHVSNCHLHFCTMIRIVSYQQRLRYCHNNQNSILPTKTWLADELVWTPFHQIYLQLDVCPIEHPTR